MYISKYLYIYIFILNPHQLPLQPPFFLVKKRTAPAFPGGKSPPSHPSPRKG